MNAHYLPIGGPWVGPGRMYREALCGVLTNSHFTMPTCPECLALVERQRFLYWIDRANATTRAPEEISRRPRKHESPTAGLTQQG